MSDLDGLVGRIARLFVAPGEIAPARPAELAAPVTMVLCPPSDALALGCAVALAERAPVALACVWTGSELPLRRRPATPAARSLAAKLRTRGVEAAPAGRLAVVALPPDGPEAAAIARDAIAAARVPAAVALAGPRCEATDCLLFVAERVCLAGGDKAVRDLAAATLPVAAVALDARVAGFAALLATAGVTAGPDLRRALAMAAAT